MNCKCPTLAVNIVLFLRLTGDLNNCTMGNYPAFALSLWEVELPSRSAVLPSRSVRGSHD